MVGCCNSRGPPARVIVNSAVKLFLGLIVRIVVGGFVNERWCVYFVAPSHNFKLNTLFLIIDEILLDRQFYFWVFGTIIDNYK